MSTAGPAWGDTSRTVEAPVLIEGAGLANLAAADAPLIFTNPQSIAPGDLAVTSGAASRSQHRRDQRRRRRRRHVVGDRPAAGVDSGRDDLRAGRGDGAAGRADDAADGHERVVLRNRRRPVRLLVLRRDGVVRRIPYGFSVTRPLLGAAQVTPLRATQTGDTRSGTNRARLYRWPTEPFGILALFGLEQTAVEDGARVLDRHPGEHRQLRRGRQRSASQHPRAAA